MLKIDNSLLQEVGLGGLPAAEKNSFLKHIYETLEMRVGIRLADQMTNQQLDEFEKYFEAKDDAGAFKWLETNFPNYKEIVQQEFDKLKAEVAQSAPQILAASQQQAAQGAQQGQAQPQVASPPQQQPAQPPQHPQPAPQYGQPTPVQQNQQPAPAPQPQHNSNPAHTQAASPTGNDPAIQQQAPVQAPAPHSGSGQQQPPFPPQQPPAGSQ